MSSDNQVLIFQVHKIGCVWKTPFCKFSHIYQWTHLFMENKKICCVVLAQPRTCELWMLMFDAVEIKLVLRLKQPYSSST